jgi:hypothetical protein
MGPVGHAVISGVIGGGVWIATDSTSAAATAVGFGVLMDVDHVYDYYQWYIKGRREKIYLLFHAWEYSLVGLVVLAVGFYHPLFLGAMLAHLAHVATDHLSNHLSRFSYSIIYRSVIRFDAALISPYHDVTADYQDLPRYLPFGRRFEPWFRRTIQPWFEKRIKEVPISKQRSGYQPDD